jgi:orotate phosphoribosyltransferase
MMPVRSEESHAEVVGLLPARAGHFLLESGHHGNLWLDLELLCLQPDPIRRLADVLSGVLSKYEIDAVCGPLVEGAFVALMVASRLEIPFIYSERHLDATAEGLFPVRYVVPGELRSRVRGRRIAIVNDVINAGSAVRGTLVDLKACRAEPVVIGSLAVLGDKAGRFAAETGVALETLATIPNEIWPPSECPLCAGQVPLTDLSPNR